jgi:hypothetical protein
LPVKSPGPVFRIKLVIIEKPLEVAQPAVSSAEFPFCRQVNLLLGRDVLRTFPFLQSETARPSPAALAPILND